MNLKSISKLVKFFLQACLSFVVEIFNAVSFQGKANHKEDQNIWITLRTNI
jgi:hypothetical protein